MHFLCEVKENLFLFVSRLYPFWAAHEKYLFALLLLLNLVPVLAVAYFFTGDGPAHLYNSHIIAELLFHPGSRFAEFFSLRQELLPNLGGHLLLTAFNIFLPAPIAEKCVFTLCLLILPLGFRYLVHKVFPPAAPLAYLGFPLVHNFCLYIGFQGFCLGLGLMLFAVGYAVSHKSNQNWKHGLILSGFIFFTAFFHLFTGIVALMAVGTFLLVGWIKNRQKPWPDLLNYGIISLPSLLFCGHFVFSRSGEGSLGSIPSLQKLNDLVDGVAMVSIDTAEMTYSHFFNGLLVAGLVLVVIQRVRRRIGFGKMDFVLLTALLLLILFFVLPFNMASGGFVPRRLMICFYLFFGAWLTLFIPKNSLALLWIAVLIAFNLRLIQYHLFKAGEMSAAAKKFHQAIPYLPEGSVVVPMVYSYHWLHYNIGGYLGADKNLIVLDNYEASSVHFPVKWKASRYPEDKLGNLGFSHRPLLQLEPYESFSGERVDAVVRWGHQPEISDSATLATNRLLAQEFEPAFISKDFWVQVYLRKQAP